MRRIAGTLVQACGLDLARCWLWVGGLGGRWWLGSGGSVLVWSSVIVGVGCLAGCLLRWAWSLLADGWIWWVPGRMMSQARALGRWSSGRHLVLVGAGGGWWGCVLWGLRMRGDLRRCSGPKRPVGGFFGLRPVGAGWWGVCDRSRPAGCCMMAGVFAAFGRRPSVTSPRDLSSFWFVFRLAMYLVGARSLVRPGFLGRVVRIEL